MKGFFRKNVVAIGGLTLVVSVAFGIDGASQYLRAEMTTHQGVAIGLMQISGTLLLITCVCWAASLIPNSQEIISVMRSNTGMIRKDLKDIIKK